MKVNLFELRNLDDKIDISEYEKKLKITLPPLYKMFLKTFKVGENAIKKEMYYQKEDYNYCSSYEYTPNRDFTFEYFMTPEMSINYWNEIDGSDIQKKNDLYPIGINGSYDGINVGFGSENLDKIFWVYEDGFIFLAESIFEFIRGINLWTVEEDKDLAGSVPFNRLYKNWGEDFWRVRE